MVTGFQGLSWVSGLLCAADAPDSVPTPRRERAEPPARGFLKLHERNQRKRDKGSGGRGAAHGAPNKAPLCFAPTRLSVSPWRFILHRFRDKATLRTRSIWDMELFQEPWESLQAQNHVSVTPTCRDPRIRDPASVTPQREERPGRDGRREAVGCVDAPRTRPVPQ